MNMDIQLRQSEIEKAIKQYIASQGIALNGKHIDIKFSATRNASVGMVANLVITDSSDAEIPGFTDRNADPVEDAPKATVTTPNTVGAAIAGTTEAAPVVTEDAAKTDTAAAVSETKPPFDDTTPLVPEEGDDVAAEKVAAPASSGLFND